MKIIETLDGIPSGILFFAGFGVLMAIYSLVLFIVEVL